ncbi:MAG: LptE family protein [Bacteroidota bacterium]
MKSFVKVGFLVLLIGIGGCRMRFSFTGASITPDMKTVSVAYFPNRAPIVNPSLSQDFTEKLKDRFISQTSLNMLSDGGDLSFEGEIVDYNTKPMAISQNQQQEQASLNRLSITINVKFTNQIDPTKNFESKFTAYEDYNSDQGLDAVEGELVPLIIDKIIEDVFNKAVVNW